MTSELISILGVEGIAVFSLILLVSLALSGFRLSVAGVAGAVSSGQSSSGRAKLRQRQAVQMPAPKQEVRRPSGTIGVLKFAESVFTAARKEAAQTSANQSKIRFRHDAPPGVKAHPIADRAIDGDDDVSVNDCRAGVSNSEPQRMDSDAQWMRVNSIVAEGLGKAKEIESLHEAAARQLDAVDYAYERMLVELKDVLPAVVEARSVCRTNRDKDYAAVTLEPVESNTAKAPGKQDKSDAAAAGRIKKVAVDRAEVAAA